MRKHSDAWNDMSNYVVHFTKGGVGGDDYWTMMSILSGAILKADNRFGIGKAIAPKTAPQEAVCFSEIPAGEWARLVERRGTKYGLAFDKAFVMSRGGGPIWYAWKDTPHWHALQNMMSASRGDAGAPIWKLTPMIDAPGDYTCGEYQFDWEREWRHIGPLPFDPEDVAFLLIPEQLHGAARGFFEDVRRENTGPAYFCPYIDPSWPRDRILAELGKSAEQSARAFTPQCGTPTAGEWVGIVPHQLPCWRDHIRGK